MLNSARTAAHIHKSHLQHKANLGGVCVAMPEASQASPMGPTQAVRSAPRERQTPRAVGESGTGPQTSVPHIHTSVAELEAEALAHVPLVKLRAPLA